MADLPYDPNDPSTWPSNVNMAPGPSPLEVYNAFHANPNSIATAIGNFDQQGNPLPMAALPGQPPPDGRMPGVSSPGLFLAGLDPNGGGTSKTTAEAQALLRGLPPPAAAPTGGTSYLSSYAPDPTKVMGGLGGLGQLPTATTEGVPSVPPIAAPGRTPGQTGPDEWGQQYNTSDPDKSLRDLYSPRNPDFWDRYRRTAQEATEGINRMPFVAGGVDNPWAAMSQLRNNNSSPLSAMTPADIYAKFYRGGSAQPPTAAAAPAAAGGLPDLSSLTPNQQALATAFGMPLGGLGGLGGIAQAVGSPLNADGSLSPAVGGSPINPDGTFNDAFNIPDPTAPPVGLQNTSRGGLFG